MGQKETGHSGLGWTLRDHRGTVIWCGARRLPKFRSPIETEAEALRWAALSMVRLNYCNIIFESDCKELVQAYHDKGSRPNIQSYTEDTSLLLQKLGSTQVVFRCREGNRVADRLAREAISFENNVSVLYSVLPVWIKPLVEVDKLRV